MEQIRIDLVPGGVTPNAHATQYDVGRGIRFLLYNGGSAYTLAGTETITVDVTKPDGTTDTVSVTNTSSNYVDFVTTDGLLNQAGLYPCEISIVDGGTEIGSQNFNLRAEADAYDGADIVTVTVGPADICTFTTTLTEPLQSVLVNVEATGGNGTPDSPNPVVGYTEANITRCGVNLFNKAFELGCRWEGDGSYSTEMADRNAGCPDKIPCKPSTTYCFVFPNYAQQIYLYLSEFDASEAHIQKSSGMAINSTTHTVTFTTGANTFYMSFSLYANNDITAKEISEVGVNYPATDTTYHAYNGQTYAIAFGQTVYGGVLDVTRGKLSVTSAYLALNGSESWSDYPSYNGFRITMSDMKSGDFMDGKANYLQTLTAHGHGIRFGASNNLIYCEEVITDIAEVSDIATWKTYLSTHNLEIVYPLATPFDIDLTPEVISAIVGTNNVFADCGQTTVKYLKAGD